MKKLLFFLLMNCLVYGQQRKYISTPTVAYNDEKQSKAVGIFLRGASIDSYEFLEYKYVYKVYTPHTETIYITDTYNVKDHLNAKDDYEKPPAIIIGNDGYYGSPHLFTTVASLKIRELPNSVAPVVGTLLNGTVVPISFYPYNPEAWIPVQIDNKKGYIPVKYVGKRPDLSDLKNQYKKAETLEEQKKFAERILELGWNSNPDENEDALRLYAEFASKNNQKDVAEICLLQADALKHRPRASFSLPSQLIEEKKFGFTINNLLEPKNGFQKEFLVAQLGKLTTKTEAYDDCTLTEHEYLVYFGICETIAHRTNKTFHLREVTAQQGIGFKIKNTFLDSTTTEVEFLKTALGLISFINAENQSYYISNDDYMVYEFQFKNGKLFKIVASSYC
ncbi:SH3 domain-containing protein [Flavobacterium sp. CBA20B-1]|uniref:SH3 domain-containing protein n=1 Tax=unclassified Flavobacterium TaxID=196869 RepID=UPI002225A180|nr:MULTISPECIES: SH3 domain-containing protein [unclassified Flavobacterium]WCM41895.1 SH3 domain-containing protein [Flavobacterium sp. CBA20B-1]